MHESERSDFSDPLKLKLAAMTFANPQEVYGIDADEDWAAVLPRGDGFLYPKELHPDSTIYGISMFHQLHCLVRLSHFPKAE